MVATVIKFVCSMLVTIVSLINIIIMLIALTKSSNSKLNLLTYLLFCLPTSKNNLYWFCFSVLQTGLDASGASEELDNIEESVPLKNTLLVSNDSTEVQSNQFSLPIIDLLNRNFPSNFNYWFISNLHTSLLQYTKDLVKIIKFLWISL